MNMKGFGKKYLVVALIGILAAIILWAWFFIMPASAADGKFNVPTLGVTAGINNAESDFRDGKENIRLGSETGANAGIAGTLDRHVTKNLVLGVIGGARVLNVKGFTKIKGQKNFDPDYLFSLAARIGLVIGDSLMPYIGAGAAGEDEFNLAIVGGLEYRGTRWVTALDVIHIPDAGDAKFGRDKILREDELTIIELRLATPLGTLRETVEALK